MRKNFLAFILALCALSYSASPTMAASSKAKLLTDTSSSANTVPFINAGPAEDSTAATALGVQVNGTEMMRVTATGSVGIRTTSPSTNLHIIGADNNAYGQFEIQSTGNDARLSLYNADGASTTGRGDILMSRFSGYQGLRFMINNIDMMIISSGGKVGIGTTSPVYPLDVNGTIRGNGDVFTNQLYQTINGAIPTGSNGNIATSGSAATACYNSAWGFFGYCISLRKFKKDIKDIDIGLNDVLKLRPVTFRWKNTGEKDLGFIAEEVEEAAPLLAEYNKGELSGVKYSQMSALLVKAIQELKGENDDLRARLEALESLTKQNSLP